MKSQKGFTYIEVIIAMVILSIVIIPISMSFVTATKNRVQAQRIYEANQYGQNLLQEIENKIDQDKVGGIIDITTKPSNLHSLFLDSAASETDIDNFYVEFNEKYALESEYSYEVAIWELNDTLIPRSELMQKPKATDSDKWYELDLHSVLTHPVDPIKKPLKTLYTDSSHKVQNFEDKETIEWKISKDMARVFVDMPYNGKHSTYKEDEAIGYYGRSYIQIKEDPSSSSTLETFLEDTTVMSYKADGLKQKLVDLSYSDGICTISEATSERVSELGKVNLVVDTTQVDFTRDYKPYTLSFVNKSKDNIMIKVLTKKSTSSTKDEFIKENIDLNKKINILASKETSSKGDINIEYTDTLRSGKAYLIAMVIRDKNPRIGNNYDVIKKMVTIHVVDKK